jgi:hypothetical protein
MYNTNTITIKLIFFFYNNIFKYKDSLRLRVIPSFKNSICNVFRCYQSISYKLIKVIVDNVK